MHYFASLSVSLVFTHFVLIAASLAQVIPDGSLSTTVQSADGRNFTIENGDRTGNSLFHSFREFSVPT
ncbi:MAG: filamentous hemagglutinin N-terminal domain-containing protein [Oculatellaceae cyanobacterium Prado106]|jgi:large exoprotein involved in heme utilization and adhesion|nr:filamentous hemagglutinin N-terminal domain-containing protein [Oculatellaceae cyanobacterium Prado106]